MNLKQLIKFGLENSSDPVIKNPVLKAALEKPRSMDQAALSDDVVPGRLKDELEGKFNPDQETYEEYLQRINLERPFNMAEGGQLVAPSVDGLRPGYSGAKFNPNSIRKLEDGTWKYITYDGVHITGNKKSDVIKKMKVRRNKAEKKVEIQKKETAKKMAKAKTTYEGVGKHLDKVTTGPNRNVLYRYNPVRGSKKKYNKVKYFKKLKDAQKYVDEAVESTGRITDEKFLELRNKNKSMNNSEFANLLNKKKWKGIRGEKFTQYNVRNRQILLDVGPTGDKLKFDLTKKEVLDTVKDMKDGPQKIKAWKKAGSTEKGFENLKSTALKKKNYERIKEKGYFETKDFKTRRKKALSKYEQSGKAKIARLKALETKGIFPMGDPELDLWRDLYLSSQTTGPDKRLTLKTKKPKAVLTKQGNKIIPWYTNDNYKKVKFLDNQTGKTITFNNLKKVLGEEKYNEVIRPYKEKYFIKDTEIDYKGKKVKLGTLINEGVFGSTRDINYFHVHHPKGKGKDPFFTQLADYDANKNEWRPRGNLLKKINKAKNFGDKRKIVEDFIETSKGYDIYTQPGKKLYGTDIPLKEKIKIGAKEAGVRLSSTKLENLLKDLCPKGKASGGRIGFAEGPATLACGRKALDKGLATGKWESPEKAKLAKKILQTAGKSGLAGKIGSRLAAELLGPVALASIPVFELGIAGYDTVTAGTPFKEAVNKTLLHYAAGDKLKADPEKLKRKDILKMSDGPEKEMLIKLWSNMGNLNRLSNLYDKQYNLEQNKDLSKTLDIGGYGDEGFSVAAIDKQIKDVENQIQRAGGEGAFYDLSDMDPSAIGLAESKEGELLAKRKADSLWGSMPSPFYISPISAYTGEVKPERIKAMKERGPAYGMWSPAGDDYKKLSPEYIEFLNEYYTSKGTIPKGGDVSEYGYEDTGKSILEEEQIANKWKQLMSRPGMLGTQETFAGGGIASIRRPNAIPPESGPNPQGLPSMYNRVRRI